MTSMTQPNMRLGWEDREGEGRSDSLRMQTTKWLVIGM